MKLEDKVWREGCGAVLSEGIVGRSPHEDGAIEERWYYSVDDLHMPNFILAAGGRPLCIASTCLLQEERPWRNGFALNPLVVAPRGLAILVSRPPPPPISP